MTNPFLGETRYVAFDFAPLDWALCDGQTMAIQQFAALFSLMGTFYGGNGTSTFQLPNLQSRVPIHRGQIPGGSVYSVGDTGGQEAVSLSSSQVGFHNHLIVGTSSLAAGRSQVGGVFAKAIGGESVYAAPGGAAVVLAVAPGTSTAGSGVAHNNLQPYLVINCIVALSGIFPSHN